MTGTFRLPDLGEGLTEAEVIRWLVKVGDVVRVDEPVAEVETAKSLVEVPSPYAGVVTELHGAEGSTIEVGRPLITISEPAAETYRTEEQAGSGNVLVGYGTHQLAGTTRRRRPRHLTPSNKPPTPSTTPAPSAAPASGTQSAPASSMRSAPSTSSAAAHPASRASSTQPTPAADSGFLDSVPLVISPLVRKLARDAGVELRELVGSGPGGLIVRRDVEAAIAGTSRVGAERRSSLVRAEGDAAGMQAGPVPTRQTVGEMGSAGAVDPRTGLVEARRVGMGGFRKAVAATLSRSRAEIPEATTWVDVDATELVRLRESLRKATDPGPGLLALMARFVVAGLIKYPELNGFVDTEREELVQYAGVNLGLAVQAERGLVVPAVPDAHRLTTRALDGEIRRLTDAAQAGRLSQRELTCGTFTLNNYGSFGVDGSAAIINHPQVAILGIGRIIDRPWVVDGELTIRKLCQLSLVFDHRICDGGTAAAFLRFVADAFEHPGSAFADL